MGDTTYRVYPYRWAVLASFMLVNLVMQALWIDFSPIMKEAASYYGVSELAIGLLAMLFMIIFLPLSIPASWAIDRFGFRKSAGLGALMMAAFAVLRAIAGPSYALTIVGTVGIAMAQPLFLNAWTKVAAHWFAESERATAVGLVTLANSSRHRRRDARKPGAIGGDSDRRGSIRLRRRRRDLRPPLHRIRPGIPAQPRRPGWSGRKGPHAGWT